MSSGEKCPALQHYEDASLTRASRYGKTPGSGREVGEPAVDVSSTTVEMLGIDTE